MQLFADNCFSPFMTADKARRTFALSGASYDFYDLDPFSDVAPSPVTGRAATPGADRRCEIAFAGDHADRAAEVAVAALEGEGILTQAEVPARYTANEGTALLAARRLTPRRVAVVHVGTRAAAEGTETFMRVERLEEDAAG
ncbi:MAG: succinyl-CoA synthetase subunit beta [Sulfitobacter sp.]|nr:succinyl-CoA synthetase subunit beta [Sulfitobacter sp.]